MGLSWQQGPLSPGTGDRFLVAEPLPTRPLFAEPLRLSVRFGGGWVAGSEDVLLLFEPGRYPMDYFREADVSLNTLERTDLGITSWYTVRAGERSAAFALPVMDTFYEEDERIVGHAADNYHRIDIRQPSRNLVVRRRDRVIADTKGPVVLYESGFVPPWYVARATRLAAWSYRDAYSQTGRIADLVSFEPDMISVQLDSADRRIAT